MEAWLCPHHYIPCVKLNSAITIYLHYMCVLQFDLRLTEFIVLPAINVVINIYNSIERILTPWDESWKEVCKLSPPIARARRCLACTAVFPRPMAHLRSGLRSFASFRVANAVVSSGPDECGGVRLNRLGQVRGHERTLPSLSAGDERRHRRTGPGRGLRRQHRRKDA